MKSNNVFSADLNLQWFGNDFFYFNQLTLRMKLAKLISSKTT